MRDVVTALSGQREKKTSQTLINEDNAATRPELSAILKTHPSIDSHLQHLSNAIERNPQWICRVVEFLRD